MTLSTMYQLWEAIF